MKSFSAVILLNLFVSASLHNVCVRPQLRANIDVKSLQRFYNPGSTVTLNCIQGFVPILGPRKIICSDSGQWSKTSIQCIARRCPSPQLVSNGELHYEDTVFQSTINYTCNEGYTMTGSNTSECLGNGMWSSPAPICSAVQCGLAPIPQHGMIVYDKSVRGNKTHYGIEGTYACLPPYVLMGGARAACTASGTWTETPKCKLVTCPPPDAIERGFVTGADHSQYGYMETVVYGCHDDFVLDGNLQSTCQQDGKWSEKPSCNAPCNLTIERGRILYKDRKLWIEDLDPNRILHNEMISFYCMNKARNCSYLVRTQCSNGRLDIPECFEEPSQMRYLLNRRSLPSEKKAQC